MGLSGQVRRCSQSTSNLIWGWRSLWEEDPRQNENAEALGGSSPEPAGNPEEFDVEHTGTQHRPWSTFSNMLKNCGLQYQSVQSLSHVWLSVTPWTTARQASLSITNSQSPPKPMSTESVMPSNHLILCHSLLLAPSIFPSIRVFSNESALRNRWPKDYSISDDNP